MHLSPIRQYFSAGKFSCLVLPYDYKLRSKLLQPKSAVLRNKQACRRDSRDRRWQNTRRAVPEQEEADVDSVANTMTVSRQLSSPCNCESSSKFNHQQAKRHNAKFIYQTNCKNLASQCQYQNINKQVFPVSDSAHLLCNK